MTLLEFLQSEHRLTTPVGAWDPFVTPVMLAESELSALVLSGTTARCIVLLDMRTAIQFSDVNAGVLVFVNVESCSWATAHNQLSVTTVLEMNVTRTKDAVECSLLCFPGAVLTVRAQAAEFFAGTQPNLNEAPLSLLDHSLSEFETDRPSLDYVFVPSVANSVGSEE